ncbi:SRPBCC family protein [Phenylobacterium sp.]|uniref:SRPBCC family protein n=1 Tax=Phenylobacterium sp. TaxID=1871053 RepID=UPI00374CE08C
MAKPTYVYVTYILSTPEKVWEALTDATISASYWQRENVSDWKVGSSWEHRLPGKSADVIGKVLESDPPRRLVTSWASPADPDNPDKTSRCAYDIEDLDGKVRLTVTHTDLDAEGLKAVSGGWPAVLSNLKTLLETGGTIPDPFGAVRRQPDA